MGNSRSHNAAILFGVTVAAIGSLIVCAVWYLASSSSLMLAIGILVSLLLGVSCYLVGVSKQDKIPVDTLELLFELSRDESVSKIQQQISRSLVEASKRGDTIFRELLSKRLNSISSDLKQIGEGRIEFTNTESWRVFYEQILRSPGTSQYRSVAFIESPHYWQDGAGRKSTDLNLELHDSGKVSVERIAIIADYLWPADQHYPDQTIRRWLDEQHRHGIWIELVRESTVAKEPELISDFGIYGIRAVGKQVSDIAGRTARFVLSFDFDDIKSAEANWKKLRIYAISYAKLLDQEN